MTEKIKNSKLILKKIISESVRKDNSPCHTIVAHEFLDETTFKKHLYNFINQHKHLLIVRCMILSYGVIKLLLFDIREKNKNILVYADGPLHEKSINEFFVHKNVKSYNKSFCSLSYKNLLYPTNIVISVNILLRLAIKTHQILKLIKMISKKNELYITLRAISAVFIYFKIKNYKNIAPELYISSDSYPESIVLIKYYEDLKMKTNLICHATFQPIVLSNKWDFVYVLGDHSIDVMKANNASANIIEYVSSEKPNDLKFEIINKVVVFLAKSPNWNEVKSICKRLNKHANIDAIFLKTHPAKSNHKALSRLLVLDNVYKYEKERVDLASGNIISIAGNTGAHIDSLFEGIPTLYAKNLDSLPYDFYGFIANNTVREIDSLEEIELKKALCFYDNYDYNTLKYYKNWED